MHLKILDLKKEHNLLLYKKAYKSFNYKTPFYKFEFINAFSFGLNAIYSFLLVDEHENPLVIMPFHLRDINFKNENTYYDVISTYGYSGPLYDDHHDNTNVILQQFWIKVDEWYKANNVVSEFIRFNLNDNHKHYSGHSEPTLLNIKGVLQDKEIIWKNYNPKVRKNVNKAKKEGLTVQVYYKNITPKVLNDFYEIYIETMDRAKALKKFYVSKQLIEEFVFSSPKSCAIALTYKDSTPISSELVLVSKTKVFSFLGGTKSEYFNLRPNDILKDTLIDWAYNNDHKFFVLGGGYGSNDGIYNFKKSFFPNDISFFYTGRKIVDHKAYNILSKISNPSLNLRDYFFPLYRKEEFNNDLK